MKKGDKVRFLSEIGGGIVAGFQGKDIVLVEDEDGFEIPMSIKECVVIDTDDYKTITISEVNSVFEVITNKNTGGTGEDGEPVYVIATCETKSGANTPALAGDKGALALIFTNTSNRPDASSVEHIRGGNATSTESPNAIAFSMTELYQHEETSKDGFIGDDYTFDIAKGQLGYSVANGKHHFTYSVGGNAYNNSFSTMDMSGIYKATLTMQRSAI